MYGISHWKWEQLLNLDKMGNDKEDMESKDVIIVFSKYLVCNIINTEFIKKQIK